MLPRPEALRPDVAIGLPLSGPVDPKPDNKDVSLWFYGGENFCLFIVKIQEDG